MESDNLELINLALEALLEVDSRSFDSKVINSFDKKHRPDDD
jgi:hypothetical protein